MSACERHKCAGLAGSASSSFTAWSRDQDSALCHGGSADAAGPEDKGGRSWDQQVSGKRVLVLLFSIELSVTSSWLSLTVRGKCL